MSAFWVKFKNSISGCIETETESEAIKIAAELKPGDEVVSCKVIPYPADPRLHKKIYGNDGACPSFCSTPWKCSGYTSCPKDYACSE